MRFKTLDDFDVENKTVIVRVDFNSEVDSGTGRVTDCTRIDVHARFTLKELVGRGAKVVVLSHQGRRGGLDFTGLRQHANILGAILGSSVKYVDDLFGEKAKAAIKRLQKGEILVLKNVRSWSREVKKGVPEQQSQTELVQNLAPLADFFVNDAFSVAHRGHVSVVGFTKVLPSAAGRVMERELVQLNRFLENPLRPCVYVVGGAKVDDCLDLSRHVLGNGVVDNILLGGLVSQLFMVAKGFDLGNETMDFLAEKEFLGFVSGLRELFVSYSDKIVLPVDVALNVGGERVEVPVGCLPSKCPIFDVGARTVEEYVEVVSRAQSIVVSGPLGVYENGNFCYGTKTVFEAIANSEGFSLAGGGHTIAALTKFGLTSKISYVSTAGGALVEALMGKKLPGVVALETATETKILHDNNLKQPLKRKKENYRQPPKTCVSDFKSIKTK